MRPEYELPDAIAFITTSAEVLKGLCQVLLMRVAAYSRPV